MKAHLTPTQVREYLSRLRNEGVSESTILEKLESLEQYVLFLKKKNLLADDTVNTIKSILQEYRYSHTEDILESEPSVVKTNTVPKIHQFESASYAGNKKTESLAGEVHVQFHFETYKISSWLFDKLKNTPIIGRLMNAGKQNPQKTPLESTFSLSKLSVEHYIGFIILLIFTAGLGAGLYNNFFKKTATPFAYPSTLTRGGRVISFQGRLTDTLGNPITTQTDVSFKLYSVSSGGSPLYTGSCTGVSGVSPDQDGIFDVLVGSDCSMSEISNSVFTENTNVFLGVTVGSDSEMTPRQQIANVGYAINAETLQGLPPGTETSSIPYINNQGNVLIAASNPGVRSIYSSATFTLSGANAVTLQSAGTGDVVVQATESGSLKLRTGGTTDANTRLIVTNNGNVGIGLTNPANMLAVAGGLGIGNTYAYVTAPTNGAIIQGNVGLGTTAPVEALDLNGRLRIQQTSSPVSPTDKLYNVAGDLYWSGNLVWNGANDGSGSGLDADFFDGLDSGSFLRSDTSDQFTSGTLTFNSGTTLDTNSGSTLDVNGDIAIADTNIALDGASTNLNATGNFSINTNDLFVKKSDGNVGIGTTNPGQLLDVIGGSIRTDNQFISTITTGTAPLSITSTTLVTNLNADMVDGYHASQLCKSDGSDCQSLASAGGWTDGGTAVYLTTNTDKVGIGTTAPGSKLSIAGGVGIGTTSSSSVYHSTSAPDGGLIIEGSLGLGTTNPSEKLHVVGNTIVTGTSDLQGTIANSAGNLVLGDTTDIGSATTGIRISTTGSISDIDAGIQLNDAVDVTGAISNSTGSILIDDQADIGSASNGLRINVDGNLSDINGNIVLNDIVDIGSETTGINVTAAGLITDIDGNVVIADVLDLGSATNGINITTNGIISDSDGNISLNDNTDVTGNITLTGTFSDSNSDIQINDNLDPNTDATFDLGDATTSWRDLYLTGQICFDDTDCFSTAAGSNSGWYDDGTVVRLLTQTDKVGIGTTNPGSKLSISGGVGIGTTASASVFHSGVAPDGGLIVEGNVGIGLTGPTAKLHVSGTAIITSTLDQQGTISNSTGNVVIDDTVDLGSSTNGLRVDTAGNVIDINGNIVLNDTVDIGSATNGLNITTSGTISDIDDVITLNDAVQITGILSDSDSNLILADTVDIGSATTGVNITTAGALSDIDGTLQLNDAVDITGVLSDSNSDLTIDDNVDPNADATYDLGDVTTSWRNFYLTGQICFDDSDCFSSSPSNQSGWTDDGTVVRLTTVTDKVGIGTTNPGSKLSVSGGVGIGTTASASVFHSGVAPDGGLIVEGNVGIGLTGPTAKLHVSGNEIITGTSDIQTSVANSTGNLLLDDTTDIGSSANGLRIDTAGNIVDINGNIVLNDTVDIGSASTGVNITTTGIISDSDGNLSLSDNTDVTGNLTLTGTFSDSNSDIQVNDNLDPNTDAAFDLGDTTTSWRDLYLTGQICFDDSDCTSSFATSFVQLQGSTPGTQQTGNLNVSGTAITGITQTGYIVDTSNTAYGLDPAGTSNFGGYSLKITGGGLLAYDAGNVGIGNTSPQSKLTVRGGVSIGSTAAGSVFKTAVAPDGGLIVEKTIGVGTTSPDSTYELTLSGNDSFVGGYITNKLTGSINTAGLRLDRGDQANGYALNYYHTAGTEVWQLGMRAGNDTYVIRYQDTSNRLTIDTSGNVSLGSDSTGLQINSAGVLSDINGNLSLNDNTDITGTLTVSGNISDPDSDLTINDDVIPQTDNLNNIGSTNNSWLDFYLTGQICFDDTNCFNNSPTNVTGWTDNGSTVILTTVTDKVGIGNTNPASALSVRGGAGIGSTASGSIFKSAVAPDGGLIVEGNVGIGTTAPTAALDMNTGRILSAYNSGLAGIDDASLYLASGNPFIGFLDTGNSNGWMIGSNASGAFEFWAGTESSVTVPSVTFTSAGNVGIATTAPSEKLDVNGNVEINASVTTYTQRLCHNGANQATTNMKLGDCASAGQADLAEMYRTVGEIEPGDIVAPDEKGNAIVRKTTKSYSDNMIGIVSTNPLVDTILGARMAEKDNSVQPIALVGRIPLKVSLENGPISIGDNLTSSSIPGVAMKAKKSGRIIATALENYDGTTKMTPMVIQDENNRAIDHKSDLPLYKSVPSKWPSNVGKIMVFANLSWHNTPNETELSNPLTVQKINSNLVKISELLTTTLQTVSATFDTVTISTLNSVISNFNKITAQTLSALDGTLERLNVTEKINTPIVETNTLVVKNTANIKKIETETIDSQGTDLTVILGSETTPESQTEKGKLARVIIKGLEGKTVASIDARGNASFSGTVTAKDASVSGTLDAGAVLADSLQSDEASISGTLNAREVRADNITALENRVNAIASSSGSPRNDEEIANLNTSINDIQQLLNEIKNQPLANPNYYQNIDNNTQIPVSTASADLLISDVEDISFENLTVSGRSSLYDVSVANSVAVGSTLIEDGSILALTWELKFAALNQVSFFDDNVVIAKNGTITTQGTLVAKGGVHTNEIKPINKNDDVNVILASNASLESQVQGAGRSSMKNSKLAIRNEQGHEVASIDASGSARFKEIALDKYLEATNSGALIAASQNFYDNGIYAPAIETNANIAGVGLLPANNSELVIYNDKVKKDSLIYVTAASSTFDKNLYVATKVECALNQPECKPHFRVAITGPLPQDVKFNWWIVN